MSGRLILPTAWVWCRCLRLFGVAGHKQRQSLILVVDSEVDSVMTFDVCVADSRDFEGSQAGPNPILDQHRVDFLVGIEDFGASTIPC